MERTAFAVIGANWGDEGKGLAVDALSRRLSETTQPVTIVRSNGGAQAGHGVWRPGGGHHVFHHVGAGTFTGAGTHLSRFFVAHPMLLMDELRALAALKATPRLLTVDPRAPMTTPWDMALNQALEMSRGTTRHGSTGLGFGETIERHEAGMTLTAADLWRPGLPQRLRRIAETWVPRRLAALSLPSDAPPLGTLLRDTSGLIARFLEDCAAFWTHVELADDATLSGLGTVLFEGAQGLQLDMDLGKFPFVTRSNTGLANMRAIAHEAGIERIEATYMTRAYATRHGAGPLPHENTHGNGPGQIEWARIVDRTNAPNAWQGTIRAAPLDVSLMARTIARDLSGGSDIPVTARLGVTCLDQIRATPLLVVDGKEERLPAPTLAAEIAEAAQVPLGLTSHGPSRDKVRFLPARQPCPA